MTSLAPDIEAGFNTGAARPSRYAPPRRQAHLTAVWTGVDALRWVRANGQGAVHNVEMGRYQMASSYWNERGPVWKTMPRRKSPSSR
jgi:hypothetical protein